MKNNPVDTCEYPRHVVKSIQHELTCLTKRSDVPIDVRGKLVEIGRELTSKHSSNAGLLANLGGSEAEKSDAEAPGR